MSTQKRFAVFDSHVRIFAYESSGDRRRQKNGTCEQVWLRRLARGARPMVQYPPLRMEQSAAAAANSMASIRHFSKLSYSNPKFRFSIYSRAPFRVRPLTTLFRLPLPWRWILLYFLIVYFVFPFLVTCQTNLLSLHDSLRFLLLREPLRDLLLPLFFALFLPLLVHQSTFSFIDRACLLLICCILIYLDCEMKCVCLFRRFIVATVRNFLCWI